jgi:hypothetical protein
MLLKSEKPLFKNSVLGVITIATHSFYIRSPHHSGCDGLLNSVGRHRGKYIHK